MVKYNIINDRKNDSNQKILFICYMGVNRSRKAHDLYENSDYIGIIDKNTKLFANKINNADIIFVMEEYMVKIVKEKLEKNKEIYVLDIEDNYLYETKELEDILIEKMSKYSDIVKRKEKRKLFKDFH